MNTVSRVKQLYAPAQPTARLSGGNVQYTELPPDHKLQYYIYCYWQFKTTQPCEKKFNHLIVADGCIDIFFELNAPHDSYVMGFCKRFTEFELETSFNYVGIRFLPTMFPQLFNVNAKELSNTYKPLDAVAPLISNFIKNNIHHTLDIGEIKILLDRFFLEQLSAITFNNDKRLYKAIEAILQHSGSIVIQDLDTGLSSRQLHRLFEFYIGDNPKTFSKVIRFQNFLKARPSSQNLRQNKLFFDAGYYDQSHFIKEFKSLYGITPARAFDENV